MKTTNTLILAAICTASVHAATVERVIVRQQWPWSTDIKVEYVLSDVSQPVDIAVRAFSGSTELDASKLAAATKGARYGISQGGAYSFTIDPAEAFGTNTAVMTDFRVQIVPSNSPANINEVLYKVFDLDDGSCENITRAQLLNGEKGAIETDYSKIVSGFSHPLQDVLIWTGVTNDVAYKTSKLVMRKVPAKNVLWKIGSPANDWGRQQYAYPQNETQHDAMITHDYFIGVFEVTQAQYKKIQSSNPSYDKTAENADWRPVNQVSYTTMRGGRDESQNGERICWPTNSYKHLAKSWSYCGKLRTLTHVDFDIPTEAEWEFACRAGTTNTLYNGKDITGWNQQSRTTDIAWTTSNSPKSQVNNQYYEQHPVGLLKPNAFGLYDMLGNAEEQCLDWCVADISLGATDPLVDPDGGSTPPVKSDGTYKYARRARGGCSSYQYFTARCAFRETSYWLDTAGSVYLGFRLTCPVGATWE